VDLQQGVRSQRRGTFSDIFSRWSMPTFYQLFRECAERWPDNVALEIQRRDRIESITYAEARRMTESVGRWLTESGFQRDARIAILADNHPRWITAYLGIIAAGCTAVPLDTAFHADQVAKLLQDSGSSLLFCDARHLKVAEEAIGRSGIGMTGKRVSAPQRRPIFARLDSRGRLPPPELILTTFLRLGRGTLCRCLQATTVSPLCFIPRELPLILKA